MLYEPMDHSAPALPRGKLFIFSAPSGTGKSTLCEGLMHNDPTRVFSISHTTRAPRKGDGDGYCFLDHEDFKARLANDEYLEHTEFVGEYYGTPRAPIEAALASGRDVLVDVDDVGMQAIRAQMPEDVVTIFLIPHRDMDRAKQLLRERLVKRASDSPEKIEQRLATAERIMHDAQHLGFDYTLENSGSPEETLLQAESLIAQVHGLKPDAVVTQIQPRGPQRSDGGPTPP